MTVEIPLAVPRSDYDNPWKHALEFYFQDFVSYFFPNIAEQIDWSRGITFLDKEFQAIIRTGKLDKCAVDKLAKVWEKNGQERWILFHIEVDGSGKESLSARMFTYYSRIFDRLAMPIISLAILIDDNPHWRPDRYQTQLYGCSIEMRFLIVKLLDYRDRRAELVAMDNPFALVILAQLAMIEAGNDHQARLVNKITLTRQLYKKGWDKEKIIQIFNLIDWLITLPKDLVVEYDQEIHQIEEEQKVNYISTPVQLGIERGIQQGMQQGMEQGLHLGVQQGESVLLLRLIQRRFGYISEHLARKIQQADADTLLLWGERVLDAATVEEIFQ